MPCTCMCTYDEDDDDDDAIETRMSLISLLTFKDTLRITHPIMQTVSAALVQHLFFF